MPKSALFFLTLLTGCGSAATPSEPFQERVLAVIPKGADVQVPPAFAHDGRTVAFVAHTENGDWVVRGDWQSPRLDAI